MHRTILFMLFTIALSALAQDQNFPGIQQAAKEKYDKWWAEHKTFEEGFILRLRPAFSGGAGKADFCAQNHKEKIAFLHDTLFKEQIEAQTLLYDLEGKEAEKESKEIDRLIASQEDLEPQRQKDLSNAVQERDYLKRQRDQLVGEQAKVDPRRVPSQEEAKVGPTSAPPPTISDPIPPIDVNLSKALAELDAALQVLEEKIATLEDIAPVQRRTRDSLANALREAATKRRQMQQWVSLLDAQKEYWNAYYAMRSAQVREVCPARLPGPPLSPERRPIK